MEHVTGKNDKLDCEGYNLYFGNILERTIQNPEVIFERVKQSSPKKIWVQKDIYRAAGRNTNL